MRVAGKAHWYRSKLKLACAASGAGPARRLRLAWLSGAAQGLEGWPQLPSGSSDPSCTDFDSGRTEGEGPIRVDRCSDYVERHAPFQALGLDLPAARTEAEWLVAERRHGTRGVSLPARNSL